MTRLKNILDFAIVGAPKCGTTSLFHSLNERQEVAFLGKDSHLLGKDLDLLLRDHDLNISAVLDQFEVGPLIGDASVWYLYSKLAAREIHSLNPNARIIICLRNPLELIPSLHNQHLKGGDESIADLNLALSRDFEGMTISEGVHFRTRPRYLETVDFVPQIERYKDLFSNVHFVFYEDLKSNYQKTINHLESFLGLVPRDHVEKVETNKRQSIKNPGLVKVLKKKPAFLKSVFRTAVPSKKLRHKLMTKAMDSAMADDVNTTEVTIDPGNREQIIEAIEKQLPLLKELTGRDCSYWLS